MRKILVLLGALPVVTACQPTVDTSNAQAYSASIQKMTANMSPQQKTDFQQALAALAFDSADPSNGMLTSADPTSPVYLGASEKIKGKTAGEILKAGDEAQLNALNAALAEDSAAIQRANAERQKNAAIFDNIHVDNARYHVDSDMIGMNHAIVSFDLSNASKVPIRAIYLHGILSSQGRSVPWVSSDINYDIQGGLEPGEHKHLDLEPNMFGDWAAKDNFAHRPDLHLSLTVTNIEGPDGTKLVQEDSDLDAKKSDAAQKEKLREQVQKKLANL